MEASRLNGPQLRSTAKACEISRNCCCTLGLVGLYRLVGRGRICRSRVNRALHLGMKTAVIGVCACYSNAVAECGIRRVDQPIPWPGSRRHGQRCGRMISTSPPPDDHIAYGHIQGVRREGEVRHIDPPRCRKAARHRAE
jgi:hypothetical protein